MALLKGSNVKTFDESRPLAKAVPPVPRQRDAFISPAVLRIIGMDLRAMYDDLSTEPIPDHRLNLMTHLDQTALEEDYDTHARHS